MAKISLTAAAVAVGLAAAALSTSAAACSTVVVGKSVSATGQIIVGHNEDNDLRIVTSQYWVPAADHKAGELITYEPAAAKIPQVKHTFGYYWTQTLHPAGYSFSDGFVNEKGVSVVSNNCNETFEKGLSVNEGGIGYGVRRLIAERAASARQAVDLVIELQTKYGYTDEGRTYTVADKNEAWQIMLLRGHRYIARKVQDDEVTYIANAFSLDTLEGTPKEDLIMSPDLIEHAVETGRYAPAKKGDYSDFSFRKAYQPIERRSTEWNKDRAQTAWEMLMGKETTDQEQFPYSIKPAKKLGVDDVKAILSGHWKRESRDEAPFEFFHHTMHDICNVGTFESVVYEMNADPLLIRGWRTSGRPCQTPYVPFYPLAKPSAAQSFMTPETATAEHFHAKLDRFDYKPEFGLYSFLTAQNLADYVGGKTIQAQKAALEAKWTNEAESVMKTAQALKTTVSAEKAEAFLHQYGAAAYGEAAAAMTAAYHAMKPVSVVVLGDKLSLSAKGEIQVAVLSSEDFDATKLDVKSALFGVTYPNPDVDINTDRAKAVKLEARDVDGDGRLDAVFTFPAAAAVKHAFADVKTDLWFFGKAGDVKVGGFDVVKVVK